MSTKGFLSAGELSARLTPATSAPLLGAGSVPWPSRILVYADEAASTRAALTMAGALAVRAGADVDILSVFTPRIPMPNVPGRSGLEQCEDGEKSAAAEFVRAVREQERQQADGHTPWPVHLEVGDPVRAILERAERKQVDLVVLGLGHRDPLLRQRGVVTPVALSRYTEVPMLAAAPLMTALPQTVVIVVDSEEPDPLIVRWALRSVEEAAFVWVLMHGGATPHDSHGIRRAKGVLRAIMRSVRAEAAVVSKRIIVRGVHRTGDLVQAVQTLTHDVNADLIVTGVHGAPGAIRSLVANVAQQLLLTSICSVLVVPESRCRG